MGQTYKNLVSFLWSRDIQRSRGFYTQIMGMSIIFETDGWLELAVPGITNAVVAINRWQKNEPFPVNQFITLGLDNLDAFRAYLLSHDVQMVGDTVEFPDINLRFFKFHDPDGNIMTAAENQI